MEKLYAYLPSLGNLFPYIFHLFLQIFHYKEWLAEAAPGTPPEEGPLASHRILFI
ncbi:hypothetical protein [Megasphaera stantonii]|jgi:hypothetical protein|uniref:hypothetical protein n=1 Tax=Megasphaera stantonii TaxID=2144175 RepID=UPI0013C2FE0F|nr:hypothetical protein [Megasphaera stantonii]